MAKKPTKRVETTTVIIADPPWKYVVRSAKGEKKSPKYDCMPTPDICALAPAVKSLTGAGTVLLMWATAPMLPDAMAVMASWGFEYKSIRVWDKKLLGTGHWTRSNTEFVLIGTRGKTRAPIKGKQGNTLFTGKRLEKKHSSKPDVLHSWVEQHYASATKIELFARTQRPGWDCIGGELGRLLTPTGVVHVRAGNSVHTPVVMLGSSLEAIKGADTWPETQQRPIS